MRESTIVMHCNQTLQNERLIQLLSSADRSGETRVYNCLKTVFHETLIHRLIRIRADLPGKDIQQKIAEEAFHEAFMVLLAKVRNGSFTAIAEGKGSAGSIHYFHVILWNKFQNALQRGYNRNFFSLIEEKYHATSEMSADMLRYNREDGVVAVLRTAIKQLKEKCSRYMEWQYLQGKNTEDIILLAKGAPGTVRKDLAICRKNLQDCIKKYYNIDF